MRTILFILCAMILSNTGCATAPVAEKVTAPIFDPRNTTEFFIVSEETMLTIGYLIQIDVEKNTLIDGNYHVKLFDGGMICDIEGKRKKSICFNFPFEEKTEIIISEQGNVLLRNEIRPGCHAIYKAKAIGHLQEERNGIRGQLYKGVFEEPYFIQTEGNNCSEKIPIKT